MPRSAVRDRGAARYQCYGKHATGKCTGPSKISETLTNAYVERVFLEEIARMPIEVEGSADASALEAAVEHLEHADAELNDYRDATVISAIGKAAYAAGLQKRAADVDAARANVAREQSKHARGGAVGRRALLEAWPTLTTSQKREQLGAAIDAVFIRRGDPTSRGKNVDISPRIHIAWRGEVALASLPGRGRRVEHEPFVFPDQSPDDVRVIAA